MKKKFLIILSVLLLLTTGCQSKPQQEDINQPIQQETTVKKEDVEEASINDLTCYLLSYEVKDIKDMHFKDSYKRTTDDKEGTAMTLLITSDTDVDVSILDEISVKDGEKNAVNMQTNAYMLNSGNAYILFLKTEGKRKTGEYFIQVRTFDGEKTFLSIPSEPNMDIAKSYATQMSRAKYGDIVYFKDTPYFILQNGSITASDYSKNGAMYSEVKIGNILIPLDNVTKRRLNKENYRTIFYDIDKMGDNNVYTTTVFNDENDIATYKDRFGGLYGEMITATFLVKYNTAKEKEAAVARRNYVANNTWIQQISNTDNIYKLYREN